jgi:hypothetical protein
MDGDSNFTLTVRNILARLRIIKPRARAFIPGVMAKFTMDSGIKELNTDSVFGKDEKESLTLANGKKARSMGTESTSGKTETVMKASGTIV